MSRNDKFNIMAEYRINLHKSMLSYIPTLNIYSECGYTPIHNKENKVSRKKPNQENEGLLQ